MADTDRGSFGGGYSGGSFGDSSDSDDIGGGGGSDDSGSDAGGGGDPGGASSGGAPEDDNDGGGSFGRSPSNPAADTGGGAPEDDNDDDSFGRNPSGGPSAGAGGDARDDNPATGGDQTDDDPSAGEPGGTPDDFGDGGASSDSGGRNPSGGPSAGAGGNPADDNAFGGPERAQAISEAVDESPYADDSQDIAIDTSSGEIETSLTGDAKRARQRANRLLANNPAAEELSDLNIEDGDASVTQQAQREFQREQATQQVIQQSPYADESDDVAVSLSDGQAQTQLTGDAKRQQQQAQRRQRRQQLGAQAPGNDLSDIRAADTALANAAERQQRNQFRQEIDFSPGVEGDPVEDAFVDATDDFERGVEDATERSFENLGIADDINQDSANSLAGDYLAETSQTIASAPGQLNDAIEGAAGTARDVAITTGIGADGSDRRQDIEQAQSRNRQRVTAIGESVQEGATTIANNPNEAGSLVGSAQIAALGAVTGGAASASAVRRLSGGRLSGGDVTSRVAGTVAARGDDIGASAAATTSESVTRLRAGAPRVSIDFDADAPPVSIEDSVRSSVRNTAGDARDAVGQRLRGDGADAGNPRQSTPEQDETTPGTQSTPESNEMQMDIPTPDNPFDAADNRDMTPGGSSTGTDADADPIRDVGGGDSRQPAGPVRPPADDPPTSPDTSQPGNPLPSAPDRSERTPTTGSVPDRSDSSDRTQPPEAANPLPSTPDRDATQPNTASTPTSDSLNVDVGFGSDVPESANPLPSRPRRSAATPSTVSLPQSNEANIGARLSERTSEVQDSLTNRLSSGIPTTTLRGSDASITDATLRIGTPERRRYVADDPNEPELGPFADESLGPLGGRDGDGFDPADVDADTRSSRGTGAQQSVFRTRSRRSRSDASASSTRRPNQRRTDQNRFADVGIAAGLGAQSQPAVSPAVSPTQSPELSTGVDVGIGEDTDVGPDDAITPDNTVDVREPTVTDTGIDNRLDYRQDTDSRRDFDTRQDVGMRTGLNTRQDIDIRQRFDVDTETPTNTRQDTSMDRTPDDNRRGPIGAAFATDEDTFTYDTRDLL